jgi:hypothetical protein
MALQRPPGDGKPAEDGPQLEFFAPDGAVVVGTSPHVVLFNNISKWVPDEPID